MIYLNRDRKTKELKVTNGLKSRVPNQKWRIYELNEKIKPFRCEYEKITQDKSYIEKTLKEGAQKALSISTPVIEEIRKAIGIKEFK